MVVKHQVKGYEEFIKLISELESSQSQKNFFIHILFIGEKGDDGKSWCPYCRIAEPVVEDSLEVSSESSHFISASVGDKATWKNVECPFRKDPNIYLIMVPTLIRWKSPQRLEGLKCSNKELVTFLLSDDEGLLEEHGREEDDKDIEVEDEEKDVEVESKDNETEDKKDEGGKQDLKAVEIENREEHTKIDRKEQYK
uniref:Thioredoxin domain-containing protein 17 n=1 Tax=Megaselia scalaris TaxID=36166 RepID=T1GY32_MEGSC